ncbi:hypothetical protein SNE40_013743 [Patella caerulea]|uniref:Uncharacterized protein n=1 Tax=Patella caerulea TaxID=87958 RepID=A0AAN8JD23_PATCE
MTATTTLTVNQLLQLKDDEFETTIKDMGQRNLMDMITGLQKEMAKEQENFNSMSEELKGFKDKNSRQYKQISKDLMSSQTRLTSLMNRSMKCFAQQNLQQGKDGVILRRRNSTKGENPSSTKIVQRSKSMYIPQDPPLEPSTPALLHTGSNQNINRIPINSSNNHASSPKTWNNSTSNIIRIQNSKNPNISSQSFSSMSPYSNHISHSTSDIYEKSRLISQSSSDIPRNSTKISINSQQPPAEKKTVSVNLHPENMKTSISIGSNYAKITSSSSNISNEPIKSDTNNEESKGSQDLQNLPNVRQLAQSFGSSKQPNAPPRPNRASVLMNRNLSLSSQTLSTPQKVNGVQSSLQNGDLESKQRGVVSQPLNIRGNKNVANVRPVSVVDARETTPQGQSVNMVQKAHSVQNLNSNTSDTPVKTTLNVSFGNSSKKTNGVTVNNMVVNRQIENKTPENRHSWFGQQGDVSNETQKKPSDNQTSSTTNINITPQPNKNTDRKIDVKSASKTGKCIIFSF